MDEIFGLSACQGAGLPALTTQDTDGLEPPPSHTHLRFTAVDDDCLQRWPPVARSQPSGLEGRSPKRSSALRQFGQTSHGPQEFSKCLVGIGPAEPS